LSLLSNLLERRIARFFVAYCAAGWAVLEVVDLLRENEIVAGWAWRAAFTLFLSGLPGALIVSWFHGAKGRQDVPRIERVLLSLVAVFALVTTGLVARSGASSGNATTRAAALAPWQDPSRVAVLYFDDRGGGDAEFLAQGLTEELIDELAGIEGLTVVSRNGSRLFRGIDASPDSVGRTLEAGTLVNGTVSVAAGQVRVQVGLVNAWEGSEYAGAEVQQPLSEIFALQDQLADTVALFLRRAVGRELGLVRMRTATPVPEAWGFVQRAQAAQEDGAALALEHDPDGADRAFDRADALLAEAEAADPDWVDPPTRRGWLAYRRSRLAGMDRTQYERWITEGSAHAERALTLAPADAAALDLRGTLRYWRYLLNLAADDDEADRLFHAAEDDFRAAVASDPNRATALTSLSHLLLAKGELAEAKITAQRAYASDRFLENANLTLYRQFQAAWDMGDAVEARRPCDEGGQRFADDYRFHQCQLMLLAFPGQRPDIDRAWQHFEAFAQGSPEAVAEVNRSRGQMFVAMALAQAGRPDSARAVALRARTGPDVDPLREVTQLEAVVRIFLGEDDEAVGLMAQYLAANPAAREGFRESVAQNDLPWYLRDLTENPRFRSLLGVS
jgi:serine/threonine-protein kinase